MQEILGDERVNQVVLKNAQTGETQTIDMDGVFIAIGYKPATALAKLAGVELNEDGYIAKQGKTPYQYPRHLRSRRCGGRLPNRL